MRVLKGIHGETVYSPEFMSGKCKCKMRNGAHEYDCPTNNEYDYCHCKKCDKPVVMYSISRSLCRECNDIKCVKEA